MNTEPSYLSARGEFATLRNAIGSWYHQDAYLDFNTDDEIWVDIYAGHDVESRISLVDQLTDLLKRSDKELLALWNSEAHSHSFTVGDEARSFFISMLQFFKGHRLTLRKR